MEKVTLSFNANGQSLRGCLFKFASNTVNYIEAKFELGENWDGFDSVRAVWFTDFNCISTVLDADGVCVVPHEVLNKAKREVKVNLVGSIVEDGELTDRLTTYPIKAIIIDANAKICGSETAEVTPSQFEQFVEAVKAEVAKIKDIDRVELNDDYTLTIYFSDDTETTIGPIRGEQGPAGPQGEQGETGNGIASIEKTGTAGYVDTYTITFTDGTTTTFEVKNGEVSLDTLESLMPVDTASGDIASFPDGQDVFPAKSLKVSLEPIQDLNGYDSPWVGGAGKNKCSLSDITFVQYIEKEIETIPIGTYVFSAVVTSTDTDDTGCAIIFLDENKAALASRPIARSVGGARVETTSFTVSAPIKYIRFYASNGYPSGTGDTATYADIMIESGSTATSFAPYENICPISGHTEVDVVVSPTTDAEDGQSYNIPLGQTVYGGELDVISGILTDEITTNTFDNTANVYSASERTNTVRAFIGASQFNPPMKPNGTNVVHIWCDKLAIYAPDYVYSNDVMGISENKNATQAGVWISIEKSLLSAYTAAGVQTWLENNPITVAYLKATPQTIQLTPQQIQTLVGQNNVWSEQGEVEITYVADIQKYIDKKTNELAVAIAAL